MEFPGFIGPGYRSQSIEVDGERCINLYPELLESAGGKNKWVLYGTPGKTLFSSLDGAQGRGIWAGNNRLFACTGSTFWEVFSDGTSNNLGTIANDGNPVQFFQNGTQGLIISGGNAYSHNGVSPTLRVAGVGSGAYLTTFGVISILGTNNFRISGSLDFTTWDPLDFASKSGAGDRLLAVWRDRTLLWLLGERTSEVWWNAGGALFPFQQIQGVGLIEIGLDSIYSVANLPNAGLIFLGRDQRGGKVVYVTEGYTPRRVSTHALEYEIANFASDAVGQVYTIAGHTFYKLSFPTNQRTWEYDISESQAAGQPLWHECEYWNSAAAAFTSDIGRFHAYASPAFNAVGSPASGLPIANYCQDYRNGSIYQLSNDAFDDAGTPIRRLRSSPHLTKEEQWTFYKSLYVDMETGVAANGAVTDPEMMLRTSNDGGHTWSNEIDMSAGPVGKFLTRVKARRLGRGMQRCFELSSTAAIRHAWINAYVDILPGSGA